MHGRDPAARTSPRDYGLTARLACLYLLRVSRLFSFIALSLGLAVSASAQTRPLLTEEAETAPAGTVVLEVGLDAIKSQPNFLTGRQRDRYDGPVLRAIFSPANNVEMDVEWATRVGVIHDPDFGSVSDFGDVTLRAKVRLLVAPDSRWALGVRFGVTLPETRYDKGLGPNALRMSAQMLASYHAGVTTLHADAGLGIHDEIDFPPAQQDFLAYGLAASRPVREHLAVVAEVAGLLGPSVPGVEAHSEARLGVRLTRAHLTGDLALRRGLAHADGSWGLSFGVSLRPRSSGAAPR